MSEEWTTIIEPKARLSLGLKELWHYRDLCMLYVRRNITTQYKQTILGPLWFVIQPLLTTVMYMVVFGGIANIPTDGIPQPLFYLAGISLWNYFSDCLNKNSNTFTDNAAIFGKVYFPRMVVPIAIIISNLVRLGIQLGLFFIVYGIYQIFVFHGGIATNWYALLLPLLIVMLAGHSIGFGLLFSSVTTKYRDMQMLMGFIVTLWMYATPVIYPMSTITNPTLHFVMSLNPISSIIEAFKYGILGVGEFSWLSLGYSLAFMLVLLTIGLLTFNKVQRNFMDHV